MQRISWLAKGLLAYHEGLCCMELINYCLPACLLACFVKKCSSDYGYRRPKTIRTCTQHINNTWSFPPILCVDIPPCLSNGSYCNLSQVLIKCPGNLTDPLMPELNPSTQRCLTKFLLDILLLEPWISLIYAWKTNKYTNYLFSLLIMYGSPYMFRHYIFKEHS
jgi:hypothetical protein